MTTETRLDLDAILRRLLAEPERRVCLLLFGLDDEVGALSYRDTAAKLGCSISTVKRRRQAALRKLAGCPVLKRVLEDGVPRASQVGVSQRREAQP